MERTISALYLFYICTCLVTGILLFSCRFISNATQRLYYWEKVCLGIALLTVSAGKMLNFGLQGTTPSDIFPISTLFIASLQACLFTFLTLRLFHSDYVNRKNIIKHSLPAIICVVIYLCIMLMLSDKKAYTWNEFFQHIDHPAILIRLLFAITYFIQICIYTLLFFKERNIFKKKQNDCFSNVEQIHLQWGTRTFFEAAILGVMILFGCTYPSYWGELIFSIFIPVLYFIFTVRYINYQNQLGSVLSVIKEDKHPENDICISSPHTAFQLLEQKLNTLIEQEQLYLIPRIVIADIASRLHVPPRELSYFIKHTYNQNFNTWINSLRIEYAKHLMQESPDLSFIEISEQSGFSDQTKFSRIFKEITGSLYSEYKKIV